MARMTQDLQEIDRIFREQGNDRLRLPQGPAFGTYKAARLLNIEVKFKDDTPVLEFPTGAKLPLDTVHSTFFNTCI